MSLKIFDKPPLSLADQADRLLGRGLQASKEELIEALRVFGYYRLQGYLRPFQENEDDGETHRYKPNFTLQQLKDVYLFDRELRIITFKAIEPVEIAIKAAVSNYMCLNHSSSHWFMDYKCFEKTYIESIYKIKEAIDTNRNSSIFLKHYYSKYAGPELPPSWMNNEILSFGEISKLYSRFHRKDRKEIAATFGLSGETLESWLKTLTVIRNICGHHSRLWNRRFPNQPDIPKDLKASFPERGQNIYHRYYTVVVILDWLLKNITNNNEFLDELDFLFQKYSSVPISAMGFDPNWKHFLYAPKPKLVRPDTTNVSEAGLSVF